MLPQKTSVFSEYESNSNPSLTSPQLEYWLKHPQPAINVHPPTTEWTLMSNQSEQEPTVRRHETFQTLQQNDSMVLNGPSSSNSHQGNKAKSYIKAMSQLQSKAKRLEQDNQNLNNTLKMLRDQNIRNASHSSQHFQGMQRRVEELEAKLKRQQELTRENKALRDHKDELSRRQKVLQKTAKTAQSMVQQLQEKLRIAEEKHTQTKHALKEREQEQNELRNDLESLKKEKVRWVERNRQLETMSEKTNSSILEKYNTVLGEVEALTAQNQQMGNELSAIKGKNSEKIVQMQESHRAQVEQMSAQLRLTEQENTTARHRIEALEKEGEYFKHKYQESNGKLIEALTNVARQKSQLKQKYEEEVRNRIQKERLYQSKQVVEVIPDSRKREEEEQQLGGMSIIQHNLPANAQIVQSYLQNDPNYEETPEYTVEYQYETRSVGRQEGETSQQKHTGALSQHIPTRRPTKSIKPVTHTPQNRPKKIDSRSAEKPKEEKSSRSKSKEKERVRSKDRPKRASKRMPKPEPDNFILKSHEPNSNEVDESFGRAQHHSANPRIAGHYRRADRQVGEFVIGEVSQPEQDQQLERALLNELNREAVRLIQEQESLVALSGQNLPSNERAENIGRLKQVSEQLRVNTQKIIELKQKLAQS